MQGEILKYIDWIWAVVGLVWLAGAATAKRAARTEGGRSRLEHLAMTALAFILIFSPWLRMGPLGWRFVPESEAASWIGLIVTVAGCGFALWARFLLGGNWSGSVTVKHDHKLVRRGPYSIVRHPIYTGALVGMFGTALAVGEWRGLAGVALALFAWRRKSRVEEAFMTGQFGLEYTRYQSEVKALIPFVL